METEAAILWGQAGLEVETIELDPPKADEVLVRIAASGMCHSDEHLRTGDLGGIYPIIGGHEGAGIVEEVGPGVDGLKPGDHVVFGFVPACGKCPSCAQGRSNLCDVGAMLMMGTQIDGTYRHHAADGSDLGTMVCLGTFAKHTVVNQASCVKILDHYPLDKACLIGCGVTTGWGSSVYAAEVSPGDDVVVIGIGGIGAVGHPGRPPGRCGAHLRHRPACRSSARWPRSSVPPTPRPASRRRRRWSTRSPGGRTPTR